MAKIFPLNSRFTLPFVFVLIVSLLFMLPGGFLQAQTSDDMIEYAENGTGPVVFTATDPENAGAITWSVKADDAGNDTTDDEDFEIDKSGGMLNFKESPDYEMAAGGGASGTSNTYTVTVVATDADFQSSEKTVTIEVTNVDEPGIVTLSGLAPYPGAGFTAELSDLDGSQRNVKWQWSRSASVNGSYADIEDDADGATYEPGTGDVGYYLRATASYDDGEGNGKSAMATSANGVQAVNVPNAAPVFPDQTPDTVTIDNTTAARNVAENTDAGANVGSEVEANDANGDILTYTLGDTGADDAFDIDAATGQIKTKADLDTEETPSYTATVTATDPAGASADITVTIMVDDDENESPEITGTVPTSFNEGPAGTPLAGNDLQVVDFSANDPDDTPAVDDWSLSGSDAGDFTITGGALTFRVSPNYEMPADANSDNVYEVTVMATDSDRNRGEKAVKVNVENVDEPGTVTLSAVQARVGVPLTASLTDIDGGISNVKWQWLNNSSDIEGATSATYTPANSGDSLTVRADYTDRQGSDKMATSTPALTVVGDTRNKAPEFPDQDTATDGKQNTEAERTVSETAAVGMAVGLPIPAEDADELTYTLGGPDMSSFDISSVDATEGQITVGTALNFEMKDTYSVTVVATDSFGLSASIDVTINVTDENEGPMIAGTTEIEYAENGTGSAVFTATDPENAGAITWSVKADADGNDTTDDEDFEIDKSGGMLNFKESPDYEESTGGGASGTSNTYMVTVVATDADFQSSEKTITIEVTNVDEPGMVTLSGLAPYPGAGFTADLDDPDGSQRNVKWQWSRSASANGSYADIEDDADGATYEPGTGDVGYYLRATASYDDGEGNGKSAMATSANGVQAVNVPNAAPVFPDQTPDTVTIDNTTAARNVAENTDAGANVGSEVEANDANGDILTYTLVVTTVDQEGAFDIDPATGQIKTKADLDTEETPSYTATVTATDPAGASADITVTIMVDDDENESPEITGTVPTSFNEGPAGTPLAGNDLQVVTFSANDPDDNPAVDDWSLSGSDAGDFTITGGALTFRVSPNYEMPADANSDNVYEVTVVATDSDRNRGEKAVKVNVENVDEPGTVTLSANQARVGVPLTASLTDIDGGISNVKWQWYEDTINTNDLTQNAISGATSATYTPTMVDDDLRARASYTDREGADKSAVNGTALTVVADTRNKAPEFPDQDSATDGKQNTETERMVSESAAVGMAVGEPIPAEDADTLTYTLNGPDASSFKIARDTGQITVGTALNFEMKDTYSVTVVAADSFGLTASIDVTINVTDENEPPTITLGSSGGGLTLSGSRNVSYAENGSAAVATYRVAGDNAASARWSLTGIDAGDFRINGGVLNFRNSPDFENPADSNGDNVYMVTVRAGAATLAVTVRVTPVDDAVPSDLMDRYDTNNNDKIDRSEVIDGINDYLDNTGTTRAEVIELINLYLDAS